MKQEKPGDAASGICFSGALEEGQEALRNIFLGILLAAFCCLVVSCC